MKFVITGGAGFIGSNLVNKLVLEGNEVHIIDNFSSGLKDNCNKNAVYHEIDISDSNNINKIQSILLGADTVFHLAAKARVQLSINEPLTYEKNNTFGTLNILKASVDSKVRRVVYSSSSSVYGNTKKLPSKESDKISPISPYALQKYYGELLCKLFSELYNLETICLRYFNVYGENQILGGAYSTVIGIFIDQFNKGLPLTINGDGSQRRDFTYVGDVVNANILSSKSKKAGYGEVINIGNGQSTSIIDLANMIGKDFIFKKKLNEPFENLADNSKAKNILNWEPTMKLEKWLKLFLKT